MAARVVVFLDYQNVYRTARERVCEPKDPAKGLRSSEGNIDPLKIGELLAARAEDRELAEVRVYLGMPDGKRDRVGNAATRRQIASQVANGQDKVAHISRALRYSSNPKVKPQQKGVDVALAVDFVLMGFLNQYDVGIIMSNDADLRPALEAVVSFPKAPWVEVAAWGTPKGHFQRLSIKTAEVFCHWLDAGDFEAVADRTNYTLAPAQHRPPSRRLRPA